MTAEERLLESIPVSVRLEEARVGDYRIQYAVAGTGKPVILIHGLNVGWGQWYRTIPELAKHFTVYTLSLPGSAGSSHIDFRMRDLGNVFVDVLVGFIQQLGIEGGYVVGHSLGGWIALKVALKIPNQIDRIVTVDSIGFTRQMPWRYRPVAFYPIARMLAKTVMSPTREHLENYLRSVFVDSRNLTDEFIDYYHECISILEKPHPFFLINRIAGFWKMKKEFLLDPEELRNIKCPVLLTVGDKDPLTPLNQTKTAAGLFSQAQFKEFRDAGHIPPIEQPEEFNRVLRDYFV